MIIWRNGHPEKHIHGRSDNVDELMELFHDTTKFYPFGRANQILRSSREGEGEEKAFRDSLNYKLYDEHHSIDLPQPNTAETRLHEVANTRRSERRYSGEVISIQELSNCLVPAIGRGCSIDVFKDATKHMGSYPSAGAMYPVEHYVLVFNVHGLSAGVYYFDPIHMRLLEISRFRDLKQVDRAFSSIPGWLSSSAFAIAQTFIPERTCVKYGPRGYRFGVMEAGFAGQSILLFCQANNLSAVAWAGFFDDELAKVLGVDQISEIVLSTIVIGRPLLANSQGVDDADEK